MMRINYAIMILAACASVSCNPNQNPVQPESILQSEYDSTDRTNDFFDNEPPVALTGSKTIEITGEVAAPVTVDLSGLPGRSLIVKETRIESDGIRFTGAYRYDGVSLYDILNRVQVVKKNAAEFNPIIDLYVVVYNSAGDSVTFSWGEIYYPVNLHHIILATGVSRIVPTKSGEKWPIPDRTRIIAGNDLITERNIPDPVRIVVRSLDVQFKVDRSVRLWAPEMVIEGAGGDPLVMKGLPSGLTLHDFEHVFYGRGMGIHGITKTNGALMKDLFKEKPPSETGLIRNGLFAIAALDGYRCAMTWSELMNRNDQADVIIQDDIENEDGGRFSCLFTADFFSDRAIKAITVIRLVQN